MIYIKNISKSFHEKCVLNNVNFNIPENSITTLIGPNGIGKTTLMNILCGVLSPDCGEVICDTPAFRKEIFTVLSGTQQLYAKNSVKENVLFLSILRGLPHSTIEYNLEKYKPWFPIYDSVQSKLFEELSTGQKRFMVILAALAADTKYLLLDEPTEGLDLDHKKHLIQVLKSIKEFKTIIVTSHDSEFVTSIADRLIFLKNGEIAEDTASINLEAFSQKYEMLYLKDTGREMENRNENNLL